MNSLWCINIDDHSERFLREPQVTKDIRSETESVSPIAFGADTVKIILILFRVNNFFIKGNVKVTVMR